MKRGLLQLFALTAFAIAIVFMLFSTTPERVGLRGIFIFFLLVYFFFYFTLALLLRNRGKDGQLNNWMSASVLAGIPTILLALQSLNQLEIRDVVIVLSLVAIVIFYWSRLRK